MIGMMSWFTDGLLLAQERAYEWGWGMHSMGGIRGGWGIGMMFFWGLIIVGAVLGIGWLINQRKQ
jgi:hypothetical protein